ncbi:MAG: DUF4430 domain-containing protein [Methanococcoides sp.]|nr:DUF4430 domain-containing protein [Methanococcoides sp.]
MGRKIWVICIIILGMMMGMPSMVGAAPSVIWDGEVELPSGTFDFVPTNNQSASYGINNFTDLGALVAANQSAGFSINISDEWYASLGSFWINGINGTNNEPWTPTSKSWSILINDVPASEGLNKNTLKNGDVVSFWFCPTNSTTFEPIIDEATYVLNITLKPTTVIWDGEVELPSGTFDFVPTNNQSASYGINNFTDLGALVAANQSAGFSINISDEWYASLGSFWINGINGTNNEPWTPTSKSWSILINDVPASEGLSKNTLKNGDVVSFWFCPTNSTTFEPIIGEATYVLNISAVIESSTRGSSSGGSGGGTGHATIVKLVDEEEQTVAPEEPQSEEDEGQVAPDEDADTDSAEQPDTPDAETEEDKNDLPGFEGIVAVFGLLLSSIFIMKRRV